MSDSILGHEILLYALRFFGGIVITIGAGILLCKLWRRKWF